MQLSKSDSLKRGGGLVTPESSVNVVGRNCKNYKNQKPLTSVPQFQEWHKIASNNTNLHMHASRSTYINHLCQNGLSMLSISIYNAKNAGLHKSQKFVSTLCNDGTFKIIITKKLERLQKINK